MPHAPAYRPETHSARSRGLNAFRGLLIGLVICAVFWIWLAYLLFA